MKNQQDETGERRMQRDRLQVKSALGY